MSTLYCQEFLQRYGGAKPARCACGQEHRLAAERIVVAPGAIQELGSLVVERAGRNARVWVLSDENTEAAAGRECKALLGSVRVSATVLPGQPRPRTTFPLSDRLTEEAAAARPELILAVGSGTVSDLAKMVSKKLDVRNWCVATAASVDAYTSATASVKGQGEAISVPVRPTEVVIADLDLLGKAPRTLFLAGLGDLLSKFLAYLDWKASSIVAGEYFCPEAAELGLRSARRAIDAARGAGEEAMLHLTDAAISSGLAMQAVGQSRPASSTEHTIAHVWEMAHAATVDRHDLHGLLVGLSCALLEPCFSAFYAGLRGRPLEIRARLAELSAEAGREMTLEPDLAPLRPMIERARTAEFGPVAPLEEQLHRLEKARGEIADLASGLMGELREGVATLRGVDFPLRLSDYGLKPQWALMPMRNVRLLRNRFSTFHLAHQMGAEEELLRCLEAEIAARP